MRGRTDVGPVLEDHPTPAEPEERKNPAADGLTIADRPLLDKV
jgi:hypothetical protein